MSSAPGEWWVVFSLTCLAGVLLGLTALWVRREW